MQQLTHADSKQKMSVNQRRTLLSTALGFALENMDVMFLSFSLSSIIAEFHISGGQAGLISSVTNLGMLLGGVVFGIIGDRIGRVKTFTYTIFIFAFATAGICFAQDLTLIYILRFIAGIGAGGEYGVGIALISENFNRNQVGRMSSIAAVGGQIGSVLAAILAAIIIPTLGWNVLFAFGLLPIVQVFFVRRHLKESDAFLQSQQQQKNKKLSIAKSFGLLFKDMKTAYQTVALTFMVIVQISGYFGLMNWLPSIVQKQQQLNVSGSSVWMISTIIGMSLGMVTFGLILDKLGPRKAFGLFLIASALSVYGVLLAKSALTLIIAGAVVGFCSNGMFGGYGAVISLLYPTEIRSTANNVIVNVGRAIGGFSSVVIGLIMDHYSVFMVMASLSVMYLLSFIVMLSIPSFKKLHLQINN